MGLPEGQHEVLWVGACQVKASFMQGTGRHFGSAIGINDNFDGNWVAGRAGSLDTRRTFGLWSCSQGQDQQPGTGPTPGVASA